MTHQILVPIDLNQQPAIDLVMPKAIDQARYQKAELVLLTVLPDVNAGMYPYMPPHTTEDAREKAQKHLEEVGRSHIPDDVSWQASAVVGRMPHTLIEEARNRDPSLIVMASHDPSAFDIFLGSVTDQVVRRTHCSVLVVRDSRKKAINSAT